MLVEQQALGFDLLWLSNVQSAFKNEDGLAHVQGLMDACADLSFGVITDTGFNPNWYGHRNLDVELKHCGETISPVEKHFGNHKVFLGWYIPHEIYMTWGDFRNNIDQLYQAIVKRCKSVFDKPVTLSPFLFWIAIIFLETFNTMSQKRKQPIGLNLLSEAALTSSCYKEAANTFRI